MADSGNAQWKRFGDVLAGRTALNAGLWLFLPTQGPWTLESRCMMLELLEITPEEDAAGSEADIPPIATRLGLRCTLPMEVVGDIRHNALAQRPEASESNLLAAFMHYWNRDAFIEYEQA